MLRFGWEFEAGVLSWLGQHGCGDAAGSSQGGELLGWASRASRSFLEDVQQQREPGGLEAERPRLQGPQHSL